MTDKQYLAEMEKLLAFMSSWDRQAALEEYRARFDAAEDPEALMAELGSPTRLAISLAESYVPSLAPAAPRTPAPDEVPLPTEGQGASEPQPLQIPRRGGGFLLLPILILGIPILLVLLCLGIPVLAAGGALCVSTVLSVARVTAALGMVSDILLAVGCGLMLLAPGILLCWLGIWISLELGMLWIRGVMAALIRKARFI